MREKGWGFEVWLWEGRGKAWVRAGRERAVSNWDQCDTHCPREPLRYIPKLRDPLMHNMEGQERLQRLVMAKARGDIAPKKTRKSKAAPAATKGKRK